MHESTFPFQGLIFPLLSTNILANKPLPIATRELPYIDADRLFASHFSSSSFVTLPWIEYPNPLSRWAQISQDSKTLNKRLVAMPPPTLPINSTWKSLQCFIKTLKVVKRQNSKDIDMCVSYRESLQSNKLQSLLT